jgi:hypothetical protein
MCIGLLSWMRRDCTYILFVFRRPSRCPETKPARTFWKPKQPWSVHQTWCSTFQ